MLGKLKGLFTKEKLPDVLTPEVEKQILEKGTPEARRLLAARRDTRPEVLYYLADDSSIEVRRQIAANPSTPVQADVKLTQDKDAEVRAELARKIGRFLPDLDASERAHLEEKTIEVLEKLAEDQLPKVRSIVAEEVKNSETVPKHIIDKLARDLEDIVAAPILEYSPLLSDDDLREIIAAGVTSARLSAIAKRPTVSEAVAADISATLDVPAVAALLMNENAQIREDTLDQIISQATSVEDLHRPLSLRPQLSIRAVKRIAGFVASALVHEMVTRTDLSEDIIDEILDRVRERLNKEQPGDDEIEKIAKTALGFMNKGLLDDKFILKMVEENRRELVIQCLALMADVPALTVRAVVQSKSGRAVTSLVWKAGLAMRTAYELQVKLALVPKAQILAAKNGTKYPIDTDELEWHLSYFIEED